MKKKTVEQMKKFGDGIVNPILRTGKGTRNTFSANRYAQNNLTLNRAELESMYQSSWVCGLAVDIPSEDATREGIELQYKDVTVAREIDTIFDDYLVWSSFDKCLKWSRLYGGAIAVIMIDGADMSTPLGNVPMNSFRGLHVFDRWQITPSIETVQDLGTDFGKPVYYTIANDGSSMVLTGQKRIHHSRVLRFDGLKMPYFVSLRYNGWGASILERIEDRLEAFDLATQSSAQLISKAYLRYYKVKGLRDILTNDIASRGFQKQMDEVRHFQNIEGMTLGDKDDEFQTFNYTFTGLPEILLQFAQQISGAIGIPLVRLFGQSPTGLNSTGESDLRMYYDNVKKIQDNSLRPALKRLLKVIFESVTGQKAGRELTFEFNPLWQMSNEQKSAVATSMTGAISTALNDGVISVSTAMKELRKLSESAGVFSSITDEEIQSAEETDDEPAIPSGVENASIESPKIP